MIRLGFIGCGGIVRHHARIIRKDVPGINIVAAADISPDSRAAFAKENADVKLYDTYRAMLAKAEIDAVAVGLPTGLHAAAVIAAAKAGKHIFCEKPMAMRLSDTDRMMAACAAAGVKLMVGQVRRYDSDWCTFKRIVDSGVIGRPVLWRQTAGSAMPGPWFMDAKMGGGPFMDGAVHNWDFANYVFGQPKEALCSIMRFRTDTTAPDTGAAIVRYQSGDEVMLSWSWGLPKGCAGGSMMDALGPKGVIKFPGTFSAEGIGTYDTTKFGAYLVDTGEKKELVTFPKSALFADEWKDFCGAIEGNREPVATGSNARLALAVALAVLKSGETRKPVQIKC